MSVLSALLRRFAGPVRTSDEAGSDEDPQTGAAHPDAPARRLLAQAQDEALAAFRRAGLPDTPGVFVREPDQQDWRLLPPLERPTDRWIHVLERPTEAGWRYSSLSQVGRRRFPHDPIILLAADLLDQIAVSQARLDGQGGIAASGRHDLEIAFELTMTWMRLVEAASEAEQKPARPARAPRTATAAKKAAPRPRKLPAS